MARIKTFTNGGSLLPGDLNAIEDDYEFAFSTYHDLIERRGTTLSTATVATYILGDQASGPGSQCLSTVPFNADECAFYVDPADRTANTRGNKYRVRANLITNANASTVNWTVGLYPVATWGGAAAAGPTVATLGAVVTGSTVLFTTPAAGGPVAAANSGDFTAPAAGWYVLAVVNSGTAAAGAVVTVRSVLQVRRV